MLHDLHESVAYLYDNTVGDGPYNAWLDPILTDEWQMIGWHNVSEMTKMGMPGVFTHGTFDTWTPGYLMFIAATHNGISRLYETFGNGGADTLERTLGPNDTARTWYKQNPPLPKARWSQRNNNNYQQTGLLVSLNHFADNKNLFLKNFYLKSKRSILKAKTEGPAAYVFPGDDPRLGPQADLLRILQLQGCEISRATAPFTVTVPGKKAPAARDDQRRAVGQRRRDRRRRGRTRRTGTSRRQTSRASPRRGRSPPAPTCCAWISPTAASPTRCSTTSTGRRTIRRRNPYDDTGWTFGELFNVKVVRVTDVRVLDAPLEPVKGEVTAPGGVSGTGSAVSRSTTTPTRRWPRCATASRTRSSTSPRSRSKPAGQKFNRGSFIIRGGVSAGDLGEGRADLGLKAVALSTRAVGEDPPGQGGAHRADAHLDQHAGRRLVAPRVRSDRRSLTTTSARRTWRRTPTCGSKYDVILFPPVGRASGQQIVTGLPMYGNPLPWKTTELTPNLGKIDSTDDMRPGLGWQGLSNLQKFVRDGGLLIAVDDTSNFAVQFGLTAGVSVTPAQRLKVTGAVLRSKLVDGASPIAYGYDDGLSIYSSDGPIFGVSNTLGGRGGRGARR